MANRIYEELSSLLYHRFTKEQLDERLSTIFGEPIVSTLDDEDMLAGDYQLTFGTRDFRGENDGIGTIFFLYTRQGELYVTETCFEFGI